ncbi:MAG: hypothetical protein MR896_03060 [Clostridiales bacterium]|nr:hypothetical protein [Clostridiales bacterium]
MIITSQIDMDFQQQKAPQEIKAVQYDANTRRVAISCYDNGEPADLSEVSHTVVHSRNADGTVSLYDTTQAGEQAVSIDGNVVTVVLDPSICAAPGKASVVVTLLNDQHDQLGIFPFAVQVSPCPVDYGETASGNYFNLLNQTITDLYDGVQALVDQNSAQIDRLQELGGITDVTLAGASIVSDLVATIPEATSETDGYMTAEQAEKLSNAVTDIALGTSDATLGKTGSVVTIPEATSETDGFMTTDQVTKVANAVTDIKVDGTALTKTNGAVNLPAATESNPGVMTAEQVTALTTAQADATAALGQLVKVHVQGTTDMYGKISLPDSKIYPLAALSNTFAITGEYNLRVVNVSTDSAILAKNTAVDFWIIGLKKG